MAALCPCHSAGSLPGAVTFRLRCAALSSFFECPFRCSMKEKPLVKVYDDDDIWRFVEGVIAHHLPLRRLERKKRVELDRKGGNFVLSQSFVENVRLDFSVQRDTQNSTARPDSERHFRYRDPYLHLHLIDCEHRTLDSKSLRSRASKWAESFKSSEQYLIVLVTPSLHQIHEKTGLDKLESKVSKVEEKLKAKHKSRVVRLTSEQEVIFRMGECVMATFDANLQAYQEDSARSLENKESQPVTWNYCSQYFLVREGMARMLLQFSLVADALLVYQNLEEMLGQLHGNKVSFAAVTSVAELRSYTCSDRAHQLFHLSEAVEAEYCNKIFRSCISELQLRVYLFGRLMELHFANQEHVGFLARFQSRLRLWVERIGTVADVSEYDVALFEAAACISVVIEVEGLVLAAEPSTPMECPGEDFSAPSTDSAREDEFPNMTLRASLARPTSMDSIGEVTGAGCVEARDSEDSPTNSNGSHAFAESPLSPRHSSVSPGETDKSPSLSISMSSHFASQSQSSQTSSTFPLSSEASIDQCYRTMAALLLRAKHKSIRAAQLMGLGLESLFKPPVHVSLAVDDADAHAFTASSGDASAPSSSSNSQRSFLSQCSDLTYAAKGYCTKGQYLRISQWMAYQLGLLHVSQGQHLEACRHFTEILKRQYSAPWHTVLYSCRLYLSHCLSHLLEGACAQACVQTTYKVWAAQAIFLPYVRTNLWLSGHDPGRIAHPMALALCPGPARPPHAPDAQLGDSEAAIPGAAVFWKRAMEGLAMCAPEPCLAAASSVLDVVSFQPQPRGPVTEGQPLVVEARLLCRAPKPIAVTHMELTLTPAASAVPAHTIDDHLKRGHGDHRVCHSSDVTHTSDWSYSPRRRRSVSCDGQGHALPPPHKRSNRLLLCSSAPFTLHPMEARTVTLRGIAGRAGAYEGTRFSLSVEDSLLHLVEDPEHEDELSYCDRWLEMPALPLQQLTGVQVPRGFSSRGAAHETRQFGRDALSQLRVQCVAALGPRVQCHALHDTTASGQDPLHAFVYLVMVEPRAEAGAQADRVANFSIAPAPSEEECGACDFLTHLEADGPLPVYDGEAVRGCTASFTRNPEGGLRGLPPPIGTVQHALTEQALHLHSFHIARACPVQCIAFRIPVAETQFGQHVDLQFSHSSESEPLSVCRSAALFMGRLHDFEHTYNAVLVNADQLWVTVSITVKTHFPLTIVAQHVTTPDDFVLLSSHFPRNLSAHRFTHGEEMACAFRIQSLKGAPHRQPMPCVMQLQYWRASDAPSQTHTISMPLAIHPPLPPVPFPHYKVCVTLTSNTGLFVVGIAYPLDVYVFSRADSSQVNGIIHQVRLDVDITSRTSKGTPWMSVGSLKNTLVLSDGKGKIQLHLIACRAGTLALPGIKLYSVPLQGGEKNSVPLAMDLECPCNEVEVSDPQADK